MHPANSAAYTVSVHRGRQNQQQMKDLCTSFNVACKFIFSQHCLYSARVEDEEAFCQGCPKKYNIHKVAVNQLYSEECKNKHVRFSCMF